jgi:hypothetical protein
MTFSAVLLQGEGAKRMKPVLVIVLLAVVVSACGIRSSTSASGKTGGGHEVTSLTEDEKHRLYTAALAASESPLDTDLFNQNPRVGNPGLQLANAFGVIDCVVLFHWWRIVINDPTV